jgi:multidrug efflux pump subunit AcrB
VLGEEAGLSRRDALIEACRKRARPVIMTTVAMGAGMLPIALGLGADGNFRTPLGVSVIGGLITSTLLSLVVVPAAYSLVAEITDRIRVGMGWAPRRPSSTSTPAAVSTG